MNELYIPKLFLYIFTFILGAVIGSFLNVLIYRIPRDISIVKPSSFCPHCNHKLAWYDLVPIISYMHLRGRCRYCKERISPQYIIVEVLTGISFLIAMWKLNLSIQFLKIAIFASLLIVIGAIDTIDGVVPDLIVFPGIAIGIIFSLIEGKQSFLDALLGMGFMAAFFLLIILVSKGGMGEGDLTFGLLLGTFLGFRLSLVTLLIAFVGGAIISLLAVLLFKKGMKDRIPFAPFLSLGGFVAAIWGINIIQTYLNLFFF